MTPPGSDHLIVDGADRRVAAGYVAAAGVAAAAVVIWSDPLGFGPWPWWWPASTGVALAALSTVTPILRKARAAAAVRAVCWLTAGGWVADGCAEGLARPGYWVALAAGTGILATAASIWATPTDIGLPMHPATGAPAATPQPGAPAVAADEWGARVAQVTRGKIVGAWTRHVATWDTGCGYTVHLQLPADGSTWQTLQPYEAGLAAALSLPAGGGATVGPDGDHGRARIDVLRVDAMAEPIAYPGLD